MADPYQDHPSNSPGVDSVWSSVGGSTLWVPGSVNGGSSSSSHYDPRLQWLGTEIKRALVDANASFGLAVLSDSTVGNPAWATTNWWYVLAAKIAAAYPAFTVRYYAWDDTNSDYDTAPTVIQTGTAGERYVTFDGTSSHNPQQLPASVVPAFTSDVDVACRISLANWATPATNQTMISHYDGGTGSDLLFVIDTSGKVELQWSPDGTTTNKVTATSTVATGLAANAIKWIRATLQVNNGGVWTVTFYTSDDGATWTQLGTAVNGAAATSVHNGTTQAWMLGGWGNINARPTGNIYEARIRDGIGGQIIAPVFPDQWDPWSSNPATISGAPILAMLAGAKSGMGLTYLSDTTRLKKLLPDYSIRAVFMSTGHNDSGQIDKTYLNNWATWATNVKSNAYDCVPVFVGQNPRISPAVYIREQAARRTKLAALAAQLGYPFLDAYQAFIDTGNVSNYIQASDGIHPTATGATTDGMHLWANDCYTAMFSAAS